MNYIIIGYQCFVATLLILCNKVQLLNKYDRQESFSPTSACEIIAWTVKRNVLIVEICPQVVYCAGEGRRDCKIHWIWNTKKEPLILENWQKIYMLGLPLIEWPD
jgi:hypothetical protein